MPPATRVNIQPYWACRPTQLLRRAKIKRRLPTPRESTAASVRLPWGLVISVDLSDLIGQTIALNGVWDLPVTEAIFRLVDEGDTVADVGANIGYMTGLMAVRVGPHGRVIALEPHPAVFGELSAQCKRWGAERLLGAIELHSVAASHSAEEVALFMTDDFSRNRGRASLRRFSDQPASITVQTKTLDEIVGHVRLGLLKVDAEGAGLEVLQGARTLLQEHRIRDIVFEEHARYPTPATALLAEYGYTIWSLHQGGLRVRLLDPERQPSGSDDPSYLATLDPARAKRRLRGFGWKSLRATRR